MSSKFWSRAVLPAVAAVPVLASSLFGRKEFVPNDCAQTQCDGTLREGHPVSVLSPQNYKQRSTLTKSKQRKHRVKGKRIIRNVVPDSDGHILGHVEVWINVQWKDGLGRSGNGYIQLEFVGDASETHWIQFIRRQKWDLAGNPVPNKNFKVDHSLWHRRGEWFLDVPRFARSPFYDECAMHDRTENRVSIFDNPCGFFDPRIHSKYVIEFETLLIHNGAPVFKVHWELVKTRDTEEFINIHGQRVASLPRNFQKNGKWNVGYSHYAMADDAHTVQVDSKF